MIRFILIGIFVFGNLIAEDEKSNDEATLKQEDVSDVVKEIEKTQKIEKMEQRKNVEDLKKKINYSKDEEKRLQSIVDEKLETIQNDILDNNKLEDQEQVDNRKKLEEMKRIADAQKEEREALEKIYEVQRAGDQERLEDLNDSIENYSKIISVIEGLQQEMNYLKIKLSKGSVERVEQTNLLKDELIETRESLVRMEENKKASEKRQEALKVAIEDEQFKKKLMYDSMRDFVQSSPRFVKEAQALLEQDEEYKKASEELVEVVKEKYDLGMEQHAEMMKLLIAQMSKQSGMLKANTAAIELQQTMELVNERLGKSTKSSKNYMEKVLGLGDTLKERDLRRNEQLSDIKRLFVDYIRVDQDRNKSLERTLAKQKNEINKLRSSQLIDGSKRSGWLKNDDIDFEAKGLDQANYQENDSYSKIDYNRKKIEQLRQMYKRPEGDMFLYDDDEFEQEVHRPDTDSLDDYLKEVF